MVILNRRWDKALKTAAVIVTLFIVASMAGILPFATVGSTADPEQVYFPLWAQLDCVQYSTQNMYDTSLDYVKTNPTLINPGKIQLKNGYTCPWVGGCVVKWCNDCYSAIDYVQYTETRFDKVLDKGDYLGTTTSIFEWNAAFGGFNPRLEGGDVEVWLDNPHKIRISSAEPSVQAGYTPAVQQTLNCELGQASADLRTAIRNKNPSGQVIDSSDPAVEDHVASVTYTDYQIKEGETLNYVVGWKPYPVFGNIVTYNGQKVRCVAQEGIYALNKATTPSGSYYYQGTKIKGWGTGGVTCCGHVEGECGKGYVCKNYQCELSTGPSDLGQCQVPFASTEVCDAKTKEYYVTDCVNNQIVKKSVVTAQCCPDDGTCTINQICIPTSGCFDRSAEQTLTGSQCSVDGELATGEKVSRPLDSPYTERPCSDGNRCCYASEDSMVGICKADCASEPVDKVDDDDDDRTSCEKMGMMGTVLQQFGLSCDVWGVIIFFIVAIIIVAILIIVFKLVSFVPSNRY